MGGPDRTEEPDGGERARDGGDSAPDPAGAGGMGGESDAVARRAAVEGTPPSARSATAPRPVPRDLPEPASPDQGTDG